MMDLTFLKDRAPEIISEGWSHTAAVCIPLVEAGGETCLLFEKRSEEIDQQPGDVCFPGGAVEEGETPREAALREMTEELLVSPGQIELLGPGDTLAADSVRVYSFVCRLRDYDGRFGRDEVAETFTVPLSFFLENEPKAYTVEWEPCFGEDFPFRKIHGGRDYRWGRRAMTVLFYEYRGRVIWGMTAKMTHAFAALCRRETKKEADARGR